MRTIAAGAAAATAIAAALGGAARADVPLETPAAIEVDRDDAPPGRADLGFDGGAPVAGWAVAASAGWLERPAELRGVGDGGAEVVPVRRRQTLGLGAALAVGPSAVVDARIALAHQVGDRLRPASGLPLDRFVAGDLRLGVRLRVAGGARRALFARGELTLPTGDDGDFAGEARYSLAWRLAARVALPGGAALAASAGIRLRGAEVRAGDRLVGSELLGAAGAIVPLPPVRPLWCAGQVAVAAELVAALGDDVGAGRGPSPVEARLGAVIAPRPRIALAVRLGRGLTDELGAPRLRAMLELTVRGGGGGGGRAPAAGDEPPASDEPALPAP